MDDAELTFGHDWDWKRITDPFHCRLQVGEVWGRAGSTDALRWHANVQAGAGQAVLNPDGCIPPKCHPHGTQVVARMDHFGLITVPMATASAIATVEHKLSETLMKLQGSRDPAVRKALLAEMRALLAELDGLVLESTRSYSARPEPQKT